MQDIKNKKVILISGATGYLGSEVARKLSKEGYIVAGLYNKSTEESSENILNSLDGSGHYMYKCDLADKKDILKIIDNINKNQGKLVSLVHCAWAKSERKQFDKCTSEEILQEFNGNVLNSFNLLSVCSKIFKEQKEGIIIGITTVGVVLPEAARNLGTYMIGKFALQGMLNTLREELGPTVKVYSVAPGFMHGGMNKDIPNAFVEIIKQKSIGKKITEANEVSSTIEAILSGDFDDKNEMTILIAPEYDK